MGARAAWAARLRVVQEGLLLLRAVLHDRLLGAVAWLDVSLTASLSVAHSAVSPLKSPTGLGVVSIL